jgi:hypothetical protein
MNGEGAPLGGTGVKIVIVHVQVTSADRLRAESIEQGHFGPAGDAHWEFLDRQMLNQSRTGKTQESKHSRSAFLSDCFFLDGLEMTLIRLLWKTPISWPLP